MEYTSLCASVLREEKKGGEEETGEEEKESEGLGIYETGLLASESAGERETRERRVVWKCTRHLVIADV